MTTKILHLIILFNNQQTKFAYHYATNDPDEFYQEKLKIGALPAKVFSRISIYVLSLASQETSLVEIQKMDPYFANTQEINNLNDFIRRVESVKDNAYF